MYDLYNLEKMMKDITSEHWKLSIKTNKIYLLIITCFILPISVIIFAFLVATDKWWIGTILLVIAIIGSIIVGLLRKWLFKKYYEALNRESQQIDKEKNYETKNI